MLIKYTFKVEAITNLVTEDANLALAELQSQRRSFEEAVQQFDEPSFNISNTELNVLVSEDEGLTWKNV